MNEQLKTKKTEIPYQLKQELGALSQMAEEIRDLRRVQTFIGDGVFKEKDIKHLRYIASQFALESVERVCREAYQAVNEGYTPQPSSEELPF
jgi:hypothetical protein